MEAIKQNSKDAKIFCLIHKMDLVAPADQERVFSDKSKLIESNSMDLSLRCFKTSIWDETLYKVHNVCYWVMQSRC